MLVNSIFSFSHNVFYPSKIKFQILSHIHFVVCKCSTSINFFCLVKSYSLTMQSSIFNDPEPKFFFQNVQILWDKKNMLVNSFFSFSHEVVFSNNGEFISIGNLSFLKAFSLDESKMLSFGNGL